MLKLDDTSQWHLPPDLVEGGFQRLHGCHVSEDRRAGAATSTALTSLPVCCSPSHFHMTFNKFIRLKSVKRQSRRAQLNGNEKKKMWTRS